MSKTPSPDDISVTVLLEAIRNNDQATIQRIANAVGEGETSNALASVEMADWRLEDQGSDDDPSELTESQSSKQTLTVLPSAYGLTLKTRPPGAEAEVELALEFDRGSLVVRPYTEASEEPLLTVKIDDRGAHVSRDYATCPSFLASPVNGGAGTFERVGDWEPDDKPTAAPAP